MIVHGVVAKVLDTEIFPKHAITDLISDITFTYITYVYLHYITLHYVLLSQEKPVRWNKINTQAMAQMKFSSVSESARPETNYLAIFC